jgi:serine/threonine-protein kinase RsbW
MAEGGDESRPAGAAVTLRLPSRLDTLGPLRTDMRKLACRHGFPSAAADDFALCVHEAVSNAIVHGNRQAPETEVAVTITSVGQALRVVVCNGGPGFDPAGALDDQQTAEDRPRGRGMQIIRSLAREFRWRDQGRELTFVVGP